MRIHGLLLLLLSFGVVHGAGAQPAERPAPVLSPEVHADHRVTFRLMAPNASTVVLTGEFIDGPQRMQKGGDGVWSTTLGPIDPDVYEYEFTVDGVTHLDPRNADVKTNRGPSGISSLLTVPGATPMFFDTRHGPHGAVDIRYYDSTSTGTTREVYIYTPPGYDESTDPLPVLYLLHGGDGEARSWTMLGRAHTILDNLIAEGRATPMIIVMPFGYAYRWDADASAEKQQADFQADLTNDLIPFVETHYRASGAREHRALAGLSRGGSQTLAIGLRRLDLFSRLGVFSSSGGADPGSRYGDVATNRAEVNAQVDLFWVGIGTEDGGYPNAKKLSDYLDEHQITHTFRTIPGAHTWIVWRKFLNEMAPLLWDVD